MHQTLIVLSIAAVFGVGEFFVITVITDHFSRNIKHSADRQTMSEGSQIIFRQELYGQ